MNININIYLIKKNDYYEIDIDMNFYIYRNISLYIDRYFIYLDKKIDKSIENMEINIKIDREIDMDIDSDINISIDI